MAPLEGSENLAGLVARCQRGDSEAFDRVFDLLRGPIYSYLSRTTGDRHLAEDLLQDVFLRMVENIGRYEESGRFEAWLFRIAANRVRDWARRKGHTERVGGTAPQDDPDGPAVVDRPIEAPPDVALMQREEAELLAWALKSLEPEEREVLILRHYSDLSFREIAGISQCPIGTVLARSHRALLKLREKMRSAGGEPT
jgi:RNA polymerase sigma-70 factor (ECF subfamily)